MAPDVSSLSPAWFTAVALGPSPSSQRNPSLRPTLLPHLPWTADILTFQVQETVFLEVP